MHSSVFLKGSNTFYVFSEILYNKRIGKGENLDHNVPEHDVDVFPFVRDENGPE